MAIYQDTGVPKEIVGTTGTKSQFNTALTDGDFLFVGDVPAGSITDLTNGTVAINSGYSTENAIRPINELPLLAGSIDNTSDKLVLYDASTDSHVFVTPATVNAPEIFRNNGALSGVAPPPFKVGIDYTNGTQYYVNASGNWTAFPPGTTVVLTDLPNGTVSINAGLGGIETAIRPITEQDTLAGAIDEVNDFTTIYDASTAKHVKTPLSALVKDLYRDRGMPNTLMTLSGVASFSRTNFLNWTSRFLIVGGGRGAGTLSTAGFYDIRMPSIGTVIPRIGGGSNVTVTASGINMRDLLAKWSTLYYILPAGSEVSNPANFRIGGYSNDFVVPDTWVLVAVYDADALTVKLGNGQILKQGTDTDGAITPFDATIDFSVNTNPNTAGTTFSPNTPSNSNVVYVSTINATQWTYNGIAYVAAPVLPSWGTTGNSSTVQATNFIGTSDNVGLTLRTNNVARQTIDATGNVGVGTTTPINKLHIGTATIANTGGIRLPITSASASQIGQPIGVDANGDIVRLANATFDATIDFSVNANPNTAGTTFSPNTPRDSNVLYVSTVDGSKWAYNGTAYIAEPVQPSWRTTGNTSTNPVTSFIGTTDNVGLSFRTNNIIRQTIDNAGNVGIGATTPFGKLQVALGHSDASPISWNNNHIVFANGGNANSSGLGIGYNSSTNEAWISTLTPSTAWRPLRFHGTAWRFVTTGTIEAFTIAPNSNVGINSAAPTQKLEVGGNIRATGVVSYATTAAAIADTTLLAGTMYTVTVSGAKQLYIK
jgi:hypothetical protein